ncbi:MAG: BlaI/MecI/CopY family transcriptional regulator [Actinomycetota bacterium]
MAQLGELERTVMERVWAWARPVSVRDVLEELAAERTIAYTTVMTIMERLARKGLLRRQLDGKAYIYSAVLTREQHTAALMVEALANADDRSAALVHFVNDMKPAEADAIRRALASAARKQRRR